MRNFQYRSPGDLAQANDDMRSSEDDFRLRRLVPIAGGQDLLGELKDGLVEPNVLVNLKRVGELTRIGASGAGTLDVGALVTLERLEREPWVRENWPLLAEAAESVATPQIRASATLAGNLCQRPRCLYYRSPHAHCLKKGGSECFSFGGHSKFNAILGGGPSYIVHPSDLAPALVALDADVHLSARGTKRTLPLDDFFTLPAEADPTTENVLLAGEIVTGVTVPAGRHEWRSTYVKIRERDSFDFALVSVALALAFDAKKIREARVVLGGVAPKPWRCRSTEELLRGERITDKLCRAAGEDALARAEPLADNAYKVPMAKGALTRALRRLS